MSVPPAGLVFGGVFFFFLENFSKEGFKLLSEHSLGETKALVYPQLKRKGTDTQTQDKSLQLLC